MHAVTADDPVLLAMPSDHVIPQRDAFQRAVERGAALAQQGYIVAFGVPPASPETGYGYIRAGRERSRRTSSRPSSRSPTRPRPREYLASGQYLWNAGIFAVRASVWIDAIGDFRHDILAACERAYRQGKRDGAFYRVDAGGVRRLPVRLDRLRGDGEDHRRPMVVRLDAGWSDVGAWDALWDIEEKDADGNVIHGDVHAADTRTRCSSRSTAWSPASAWRTWWWSRRPTR